MRVFSSCRCLAAFKCSRTLLRSSRWKSQVWQNQLAHGNLGFLRHQWFDMVQGCQWSALNLCAFTTHKILVLPFGQELNAFLSQQPQQLRLKLVPRTLAIFLIFVQETNINNTLSFSLGVTSFAASHRSLSRSNPVISFLKKQSLFTTPHRKLTLSCQTVRLQRLQGKGSTFHILQFI